MAENHQWRCVKNAFIMRLNVRFDGLYGQTICYRLAGMVFQIIWKAVPFHLEGCSI
ncbi:hypothetical protein HMPREF1991_02355 [Hoylesella loescheii DSM 19665 = JCM 12249 = ATCC 15930]|uniref:Uncharacterized protein n=1 Tax=Hoylesella loescheii DSM 19665 = JCM 12249 = ATCC 15930 TaxID=1122985 RepID=A0A069QFL9_HOYLO|nr:hypothetical protein HMPREF1991_02355 [Hoylesella loescheii DSM 19665 = JCM 12249 = ATCC 15930]